LSIPQQGQVAKTFDSGNYLRRAKQNYPQTPISRQ